MNLPFGGDRNVGFATSQRRQRAAARESRGPLELHGSDARPFLEVTGEAGETALL
jgi:hypothetical protein